MPRPVPIHNYHLTTIRSSMGRPSERGCGIQMVGAPAVGRPMVMYDAAGETRIVTSPVVRMFEAPARTGTYVETTNTLYLLEGGAPRSHT